MTFDDLIDFQEHMISAYVRNVMMFATLPYYLVQETCRNSIRSTR
jgi:hypothetical protein